MTSADFAAKQSDLHWLRERNRRGGSPVVSLDRYRAVQLAVAMAAVRRKVTPLTARAARVVALAALGAGDSAANAINRGKRVLREPELRA